MKNKFNLEDTFITYDDFYDTFVKDKVTSIKELENGTIMYNGRYQEEYCFSDIKLAMLKQCDFETQQYKNKIKHIEEAYEALKGRC